MSDNKQLSNDHKTKSRDKCDTTGGPCACGAWHDHKPHDPENCLTREEMDHPFRAVIHFNLDDPEGERRLRECLDAPKWKSAVWGYDQWLRNKIKYNDAAIPEHRVSDYGIEWLQIARDRLWDQFRDNSIDLTED